MSGRSTSAHHRRIAHLVTLALAMALTILPFSAASAGLLDALFGRMRRLPPPTLPPQIQAYAPAAPLASPAPANRAPSHSGRGTVFCVRLCDGRYFPIQRHAGLPPTKACSSFCPASRTKTFSGGNIAYAVASDGTRYSDLANAFRYRKQLVTGCTCNGRDAFGLAPLETASDPTLRKGDIVATRDGFVAFSGRQRADGRLNFTPVDTSARLSADLRQRLSETKVMPAPAATALPLDANATSVVDAADRQAQLVR